MQITVASLHGSPAPLHEWTHIRLNSHSLILTYPPLPSIYHSSPGSLGSTHPPLSLSSFLPTPLLLSVFWHFGSFCHVRGPTERWGASVIWWRELKIPCRPLCEQSQRSWMLSDVAEIFLCCHREGEFHFYTNFHKMLDCGVFFFR